MKNDDLEPDNFTNPLPDPDDLTPEGHLKVDDVPSTVY